MLVVALEVETADVVQEERQVPDFAVATAQMIVAGKMNRENGVVV